MEATSRGVGAGTAAWVEARTKFGRVNLHFGDPAELGTAVRFLDPMGRDDQQLTLDLPGDGGVGSIRAVLDRLDRNSIEVDSLTVHTPRPR